MGLAVIILAALALLPSEGSQNRASMPMWHGSFFPQFIRSLMFAVCVPFNIYKDIYDHTRLDCSPILSRLALLSCDSLTIDAMRRLATTTKERRPTNSLHFYLLDSRCQSHSLLSHCNPGHAVNSANPELNFWMLRQFHSWLLQRDSKLQNLFRDSSQSNSVS